MASESALRPTAESSASVTSDKETESAALAVRSATAQPCKADAATADRRAFPRHDSASVVTVCPRPPGTLTVQRRDWLLHASRLKGRLVDVSMNGVAFILPESLDSDATILLRLSNPRFDKRLDTTVRVLRSIPLDDGQWKLVGQFEKRLALEAISVFGKSLASSKYI